MAAQRDASGAARDKVQQQEAEANFHRGFTAINRPRINRRNAQQPRPSRQKVNDADMTRWRQSVKQLPAHKQVPAAHRLALAEGVAITLQAFRRRFKIEP